MGKKKESICAVVVTYNRKELLKEALNSLLDQTYKFDKIIIVNNASTDGTEEMLKKEYLSNDIFAYINTGENIGGAGGFHEGMKKAYNDGYDYIFLMDDDVIIYKNGLEKILSYIDKGDIIIGRKKNKDNSDFEFAHNIQLKNLGYKKLSKYDKDIFKDKNYINQNAITFEAILINKNIISKIGLPQKDFFIAFDDACFGLKAFLNGFKIIYIKEYIAERLLGERVSIFLGKPIIKIKPFSFYYQIRNQFLLFNCLKKYKVTKTYLFYFRIFTQFFVFILFILFTQKQRGLLLKKLITGLKDGLLLKKGK